MAALTDAAPPLRRQPKHCWDPDAWSCPDPQRCVRCDCASPSTPGVGVVNFILDNQAADCEDYENNQEDDGERWFLVGCSRPYQYQPLLQVDEEPDDDEDVEKDMDDEGEEEVEGEEDELAILLLEEKTTVLLPVGEDERQQHLVKAASETKKKRKKKANSSSSDDSSSSSSSSTDSDDSSSSSSDSSSSSSSSSDDTSSSSSDSSDSSTSSDSSSSDSSDDDSKKKKKKKHQSSGRNSREKGSRRKGGNGSQNKNSVLEIATFHGVGAVSHAPIAPAVKDDANYDDEYGSFEDFPPMTSVLSTVVKVTQKTSSRSNTAYDVKKAHDELEYRNSSRKSKKHHNKRDR